MLVSAGLREYFKLNNFSKWNSPKKLMKISLTFWGQNFLDTVLWNVDACFGGVEGVF